MESYEDQVRRGLEQAAAQLPCPVNDDVDAAFGELGRPSFGDRLKEARFRLNKGKAKQSELKKREIKPKSSKPKGT